MNRKLTDREVYPAAWITLAILLAAAAVWKYGLGAPTIAGCSIYRQLGIYCPGCGGTRAVEALLSGNLLRSFLYHPLVPVSVLLGVAYMVSQTIWRLRKGRGWVLHYHTFWPTALLGLLLANWALRNILLLGFGIAI